MKKNLPNIISVSRIVFALLLLYFQEGWIFYAIYLYVGISDVADGYIARRFQLVSSLGARLDTLSDGVFFLVYFMVFGPDIITHLSAMTIMLLFAILLLRLIALYLSQSKFGQFLTYHTISNKITGLWLFLIPLWLDGRWILGILWGGLVIGLLAALEEVLLMVTCTAYHPDRRSLFIGERDPKSP